MKWSFQENPPIVERDPLIKAVESPVTAVAHRASRCLQHHHSLPCVAKSASLLLSINTASDSLNTAEIKEKFRETENEEGEQEKCQYSQHHSLTNDEGEQQLAIKVKPLWKENKDVVNYCTKISDL